MDPLTPANRGTLMDHRLDLELSKADSGVNKVVWEVSLEALGRADKGSKGGMYRRPSMRGMQNSSVNNAILQQGVIREI